MSDIVTLYDCSCGVMDLSSEAAAMHVQGNPGHWVHSRHGVLSEG